MDPQFSHKHLALSIAAVDIEVEVLWDRGYSYTDLSLAQGLQWAFQLHPLFQVFSLGVFSSKFTGLFVSTWWTWETFYFFAEVFFCFMLNNVNE